jgi:hypothetical protein
LYPNGQSGKAEAFQVPLKAAFASLGKTYGSSDQAGITYFGCTADIIKSKSLASFGCETKSDIQ